MPPRPTYAELKTKVSELEKEVVTLHNTLDSREDAGARLQETSAMLAAVLDAIPDILGVQDADHRIIRYNEAGYRFLGMTQEQVEGKKCFELINRDHQCDVCATSEVYRTKKSACIEKFLESAGVWLDARAYPILDEKGCVKHVIEHLRDITEEKRAEERLESLNRTFLDLTPDFDRNINRITSTCGLLLRATCALYNRLSGGLLCSLGQWEAPAGYNPVDRPEGHICYDVIKRGPNGGPFIIKNLQETVYMKTDPNVAHYALRTYVGHPVTCFGEAVGSLCVVYKEDVEFDANEKRVLGILAKGIGIEEERRMAEEALRQSEERYRLLVENANDAIFVVQDGQITFPNRKAREMGDVLGVDPGGFEFVDAIHPEDRELILERYAKRLRGEEVPHTYVFRLVRRDEEEMWVQITAVRISWEGNPATLNFLRDVTPLKKLEAQLHQAERLEAIGTLAGGVAHDFNNLLMGIQGGVSLMLMDVDEGHPHWATLMSIEESIRSGVKLTQQLLGFARGGKYRIAPARLNDLVKRTLGMFLRTRKRIRVHEDLQRDLWTVEVDEAQIEQVLLNLYLNAWQAMSDGGGLFVQTQNTLLERSFVGYYDLPPGRYVKLHVKDTGTGMDEKTMKRVFEPFFTTREVGRGTGLGLASAYGIIKNHSGIITVSSELGKGSSFDVYLPASDRSVREKGREIADQFARGCETILLVDDEETILDVAARVLSKLGYAVVVAKTGREALDILRGAADGIDLVILDMVMPDMGGRETCQALKKINPSIKVLLSSGYPLNDREHGLSECVFEGFVQKPFSMKHLSQHIRQILDADNP